MTLGHPPQRLVIGGLQFPQHGAEGLEGAALAPGLEACVGLLVRGAGRVPVPTRLAGRPDASRSESAWMCTCVRARVCACTCVRARVRVRVRVFGWLALRLPCGEVDLAPRALGAAEVVRELAHQVGHEALAACG